MFASTFNSTCQFNRCTAPATQRNKCKLHRMRTMCMVDHCTNQVYARKLCVKHGGKRRCQAHDCEGNARSHGFCCKHGPKPAKRQCPVEGCLKYAHSRRFCVEHGRSRKCCVESCTLYARSDRLCQRHSSVTVPAEDESASQVSFGANASYWEELILLGEKSIDEMAMACTIEGIDWTADDAMFLSDALL